MNLDLKYPSIVTVFKRDPDNKFRTLLAGEWAWPEFEYLVDNKWVFTEKIHGTNIRVGWDGEKVAFGGRTDKAQIPPFLLARLKEMFRVELFKAEYPDLPMILYGEGYGARIQKGGGNYIPDGVNFILFDVMINGNWQPRASMLDIAVHLDISTVPFAGYGTLNEAVEMVQGDLPSFVGNCQMEGLVMRPEVELRSRTGKRIITKIKRKDFGLK